MLAKSPLLKSFDFSLLRKRRNCQTRNEYNRQREGAGVRYRASEIQSLEKMLADRGAGGGARGGAAFEESERLAQLPEVREKISEMMATHWEHWVSQPLPILGNRTPMDAVKDPDGREIVESLVIQAERNGRSPDLQTDENVFRRLRGRLGLAGGRSTKSASTIG